MIGQTSHPVNKCQLTINTVTGNISSHLLSLLNGYKASELGHNGVLLTNVDDVRLAVTFDDLYSYVHTHKHNVVGTQVT